MKKINEKEPICLDLDDLQEKLGGISNYQIVVIILVSIFAFACGPASQIAPFIAGTPDYMCAEYKKDLISIDVNWTEAKKEKNFDRCKKYSLSNEENCENSILSNGLKSNCINLSSYDSTTNCQKNFLYKNDVFKNSVVTEFNVVCEREIWNTLANSLFFIGYMIGSAVTGPVCDWFGRKKGIALWWTLYCIFQCAISTAPNFLVYTILRICVGAPYVAVYISVITHVIEMSPTKYRTYQAMWISLMATFSHTALPLAAYFFREWRQLELITGLSTLPCIFLFYFIPESPRWLLSVGRNKEARKIVERYAKSNKTVLIDSDWKTVVETEHKKRNKIVNGQKYSMLDLFKRPRTRLISIAVSFAWFTVCLVFYGLVLNVDNLAGDIFINGLLNAGIEVIGNLIVLFVKWTGKRNMTTFSYLLSGFACLGSTLITTVSTSKAAYSTSRILAIIGKMGAQTSFALIYSVTADVYPTILRSTGIGLGSMMARIGGIATPFTVQLQRSVPWLTQTIFGTMGLFAGIVCMFFPETEDSFCLTTLDEAEEFFITKMTLYNKIFKNKRTKSELSMKNINETKQTLLL